MSTWPDEFRHRMRAFEAANPPTMRAIAVSIKVRVTGGCFHREHSPNAYETIDQYIDSHPSLDVQMEEHESGPEILVLVTAGLNFIAGVVGLVAAIILARQAGIRAGDHPSEPVELIIRRIDKDGELEEEMLMRFNHHDPVERKQIADAMVKAIKKFTGAKARVRKKGKKKTPAKGKGSKARSAKKKR